MNWKSLRKDPPPLNTEVLFGYYGTDNEQWYGYYWKGHLFQWEKMPKALSTGGPGKIEPTHWMEVEEPSG